MTNASDNLYFGAHTKRQPDAPLWAVSDGSMNSWIEEWIDKGFIKDYLDYARDCGVTPTVYHVATVLTTVSYSLARCEIAVESFTKDPLGNIIPKVHGREQIIRPVLWSAIIGESGDRKSTAMDFGRRILTEAIKKTQLEHGEAPDVASPEALTEHMAEHGPVFTFRDELSTILANSKRNHLEHMKPTLLTIYEHKPLTRRKAKDTSKRRDGDGGEAEAYKVEVEVPIKMILGCIPPRVFAKQTSVDDWDTGLLPRFVYWPGYLDICNTEITSFDNDAQEERKLSRILRSFFIKRRINGLRIIVPAELNYEVAKWNRERPDALRGRVSGAFHAYLRRSYTTIIRIAAILAAGELAESTGVSEPIYVTRHHIDAAIELMDTINPRLMDLFEHTKRDRAGTREEALLAVITTAQAGITLNEIMARLDDAPSRSLITREVKELEKAQLIRHKALPNLSGGRAPNLYYVTENIRKVNERVDKLLLKSKKKKQKADALRKREERAAKKLKIETMESMKPKVVKIY